MIPKILHLIWLDADRTRPDDCIHGWAAAHPDWQIKLWGWDDITHKNWINADAMHRLADRGVSVLADLMRWEVLYSEGGVVVDADTLCMRKLPDWLLEVEAFACWLNEDEQPGLLSCGFVGCAPESPLIGQVIHDIHQDPELGTKPVSVIAGSGRFTQTWNATKRRELFVLPSYAFIPRQSNGLTYNGEGYVYGCKLWQRLLGRPATDFGASQPLPAFGSSSKTACPSITIGLGLTGPCSFLEPTITQALSELRAGIDELLIVDAGSHASQLDSQDARYRYVNLPAGDHVAIRNRLLAEARGDYVLWLDGDDLVMPGVVTECALLAKSWPELSFFYGDLRVEHLASRQRRDVRYEQHFGDPFFLSRQFALDSLPQTGFLAKTEVMRVLGGYDPSLADASNQDFWLRVAGAGLTAMHVGRSTVTCLWHEGRSLPPSDERAQAELRLIRSALDRHALTDLCADLPWQDKGAEAESEACCRVARMFDSRGDVASAQFWSHRAEALRAQSSHPVTV